MNRFRFPGRYPGVETSSLTLYGRRSFISKLGKTSILAGLGLTACELLRQPETRRLLSHGLESLSQTSRRIPENVTRVTTKSRAPSQPVTPLHGQENYRAYLETLSLRYISPDEIFAAHRRFRNGVHNTLPPENLWSRMAPTLKIADELRHRLGVPLTYITSAYRCPDYNKQCPGAAKYSQHMQNRALDLIFACDPEKAFTEARKMRDEGIFKGGLGLYSSFVHIDTRGNNATWGA